MTVISFGDDAFSVQMGAGDNSKKHVLIAALGNPLRGDDGVGSAIIQTLKNEYLLLENVTYYELSGSALLPILIDSRFDKVIIVETRPLSKTKCWQVREVVEKAL